jgi:hypothetical protein
MLQRPQWLEWPPTDDNKGLSEVHVAFVAQAASMTEKDLAGSGQKDISQMDLGQMNLDRVRKLIWQCPNLSLSKTFPAFKKTPAVQGYTHQTQFGHP